MINKCVHVLSLLGNKGKLTKEITTSDLKGIWKDKDLGYHLLYLMLCVLGWLGHEFIYCGLVRKREGRRRGEKRKE